MKKLLGILAFLFCGVVSAQPCTQTLNPPGADIAAAILNAGVGTVICLNSGTYPYIEINANKSGPVILRSTTGTEAVIADMLVWRSRNIVFRSLTIGGFRIDDFEGSPNTRNIYIIGNVLTGLNVFDMAGNSDANIVLYGNTIGGYDKPVDGNEGTLQFTNNGSDPTGPAGIRVEHNLFEGGHCADGVQNSGQTGITIGPGNIFRNWITPCNDVHVDAIQLQGGSINVTGNYFENNSVHIGYYDGGDNCVITNNIFNGGGVDSGGSSHQAFQIGGINGMLFAHNTIRNIATSGIGTKIANSPNINWVIENNVLVNSTIQPGGDQPGCGANCIVRFNLLDASSTLITGGTNTDNTVGTASFAGGSNPATNFQGWRLNSGSPGQSAANDGKDVGSNFFNAAALGIFQNR